MADGDGEESEVRVKNTFLEIRSCSSEASRSSLRRCRSDEDILHFWLAPSRSESATGSALSSYVGAQNSLVGVNQRFEVQRFYGRPEDSQAASSSRAPETAEPPSEAQVLAAASSKLKEVQREAGKLPPELQELDPEELLRRIPRNADGELTSVGSITHEDATCSPCIFWFRNNCSKGIHCTYCHFKHEGQKNKRIRPSKKTRMLQRSMAAKAEGEGGEESGDDQQAGAGQGPQQATQQQVPYNPALGPSAPGMQSAMPFPQERVQNFMSQGQDGWPQVAQPAGLMPDRGAPVPMGLPGRDFEGFGPSHRDMRHSPNETAQPTYGLPLEAPPGMSRDLDGPGQMGFAQHLHGGAPPNMGDAQMGFMRGPERAGPSSVGFGRPPDGSSPHGMMQDPDAQLGFARAQQAQGQQGMGRGPDGQMRVGFERMPERGMYRSLDGQVPMGFERMPVERMPERGMGRGFDGQYPVGFERAPQRGGNAFGYSQSGEQGNPMGALRGPERTLQQGYGPFVGEPGPASGMRMPERLAAQGGFARAPGGPVQMDFAQGPDGMPARRAPESMMGFGRAPEGMMGFRNAPEGPAQQPYGFAMERPLAQGYGQALDGRPPMDMRRTAEGPSPTGYMHDPYCQNPQGVQRPLEGTAPMGFGQALDGAPPMGFGGHPHHDQLQ